MKKMYYAETNSNNPHYNLAYEEMLFKRCEREGVPILFLWQNEHSVIIGRNQCAYAECDVEFCLQNDIDIVRRMTGGGAVFHDLGNLNFSIIQPLEQYDIEKSMTLIVDALKEIGIIASVNGRNDICIGEKKISGNAYYKGEKAGLHHGTLLFSYNPRIMKAAITPSKSKLLKHGVKSVESRVGDISSVYQSVSIKLIAEAIRHSFERDTDLLPFEADTFDLEDLGKIQEKYESEEWNYNKVREYGLVFEDSFSWGEVSLSINYEDGRLKQIDISSDSMHVDLIEQIKDKINDSINKKMEKDLIFQNIENEYKGEAIISDLADMWRKVIKNGI